MNENTPGPCLRLPWQSALLAAAVVAGFAAAGCSDDGNGAASADIGPGVTTARTFEPFVASDKLGTKPDVPPVLAFVQDSPRGFEQLLASGLEAGAKDAGLEFDSAQSNADPQTEVRNMEQFLVRGIGALVVLPVDPTAQAVVMKKALARGVAVGVIPPATLQVNAPQYQGGKALADQAATYIKTELGGRANVVLLNSDSVVLARPRFQAIRDVLKTIPEVKIVADVEPTKTDTEGGFKTMSTILQKNPDVDVVLGADAVVQGALSALEAQHKDSPRQFLGGIDCELPVLELIERGNSPYKVCVGLSPTVFGYAWARYAGRWREGKNIPQQMCVRPVPVTNAAEVVQYKQDGDEPGAVFDDPERLSRYIGLYGSISYDTRERYTSFQWSPKTC
jgi:ribose transport system substrate-binding protein